MSKVNKQDVAELFHVPLHNVEQIDSKQLFTVNVNNITLLVSYLTIIGVKQFNIWKITTKKYSVTTTRQITEFSRGWIVERIPEEQLQELIKLYLINK